MKRWNIVLMMTLLLLSVWTLSSCSNKMMPVNTLRRLSTNMEVKGDMYTLKDWNKVGAVTTGVKSVVDEIKELIDAFSKKKEKEE